MSKVSIWITKQNRIVRLTIIIGKTMINVHLNIQIAKCMHTAKVNKLWRKSLKNCIISPSKSKSNYKATKYAYIGM